MDKAGYRSQRTRTVGGLSVVRLTATGYVRTKLDSVKLIQRGAGGGWWRTEDGFEIEGDEGNGGYVLTGADPLRGIWYGSIKDAAKDIALWRAMCEEAR